MIVELGRHTPIRKNLQKSSLLKVKSNTILVVKRKKKEKNMSGAGKKKTNKTNKKTFLVLPHPQESTA